MTDLTETQLEIYAKKMLSDYDSKTPSTIFKDRVTITIKDAWRIQSAVAQLRTIRGEKVVGYKIGCVSKKTQKEMGFTKPAWGRLWNNEIHTDGVTLKKHSFSNPAMEAEFGIILKRDLLPDLISLNYIVNSVETIHPVIEIHNLVFNGHRPFGPELLANNAIHAGVVLGTSNKGGLGSQNTDLKLIFDKEEVDAWKDKKWPNDMLSEVEWLVKEQAKLGNILRKGNLILTGAFGLPIPINGKNLIEVTSPLFGKASAIFE